MIQDAAGQVAIDSHHPAEGHDDNCRCELCDDGPMLEHGYHAGEWDGEKYPIYIYDPFSDIGDMHVGDYVPGVGYAPLLCDECGMPVEGHPVCQTDECEALAEDIIIHENGTHMAVCFACAKYYREHGYTVEED